MHHFILDNEKYVKTGYNKNKHQCFYVSQVIVVQLEIMAAGTRSKNSSLNSRKKNSRLENFILHTLKLASLVVLPAPLVMGFFQLVVPLPAGCSSMRKACMMHSKTCIYGDSVEEPSPPPHLLMGFVSHYESF